MQRQIHLIHLDARDFHERRGDTVRSNFSQSSNAFRATEFVNEEFSEFDCRCVHPRLILVSQTLRRLGMFPDIQFNGELRPSQADVVKIAREQLEAGERQLHIVAPPGSGKTVTGLYLWAEVIQKPTLVLCPNSAIQSQWAARTDLFSADGKALPKHWVSTETEQPSRGY